MREWKPQLFLHPHLNHTYTHARAHTHLEVSVGLELFIRRTNGVSVGALNVLLHVHEVVVSQPVCPLRLSLRLAHVALPGTGRRLRPRNLLNDPAPHAEHGHERLDAPGQNVLFQGGSGGRGFLLLASSLQCLLRLAQLRFDGR